MRHDAVLVTGGNSGIGFECARELARAGWDVIIASRNRQASGAAVERIVAESKNERVEALELDLSSLTAVRQFAAQIHAGPVGEQRGHDGPHRRRKPGMLSRTG